MKGQCTEQSLLKMANKVYLKISHFYVKILVKSQSKSMNEREKIVEGIWFLGKGPEFHTSDLKRFK